jgi:hypothetical protein
MSDDVQRILLDGSEDEFKRFLQTADIDSPVLCHTSQKQRYVLYRTPLQLMASCMYNMYEPTHHMDACERDLHGIYYSRMKDLLEAGASTRVGILSQDGKTPLFYFCRNNSPYDRDEKMRVIMLLLKHTRNASDFVKSPVGRGSLLHHAASCNRAHNIAPEWCELVELLIQYGANVNAVDGMGRTPLHCAALADYPGTVRILIEHGADMLARDASGHIPAHVGGIYGNVATNYLCQLLREHAENRHRMRDVVENVVATHRGDLPADGVTRMYNLPPEAMENIVQHATPFFNRYDDLLGPRAPH